MTGKSFLDFFIETHYREDQWKETKTAFVFHFEEMKQVLDLLLYASVDMDDATNRLNGRETEFIIDRYLRLAGYDAIAKKKEVEKLGVINGYARWIGLKRAVMETINMFDVHRVALDKSIMEDAQNCTCPKCRAKR